MNYNLSVIVLVLLLVTSTISQTKGDKKDSKVEKISADEIVSKHLASIGPVGDIKSLVLVGKGKITSKLGSTFSLSGISQLASTGNSSLLAIAFEYPHYPYEKLAFDGKDVSIGLVSGKGTVLGQYIKAQTAIMKEGLFGGSLTTAWPLLTYKFSPRKINLEYDGTSKIEQRLCYKIKYSSSKSGDLKILLYFDSETFRHLRSEYLYTIEPRIGSSPTDVRSSSRIERYKLTEDFGDFKTVEKLTLPFLYNINVTIERQIATNAVSRDWSIEIEQVYFDESLKPEMFKVL